MKKLLLKLNFAIVGVMATGVANAADVGNNEALCELAREFGGVFGTLRTLAFVGAAFILAGWAWDFIAKGEVKLDDVKKKGIGMLVGFIILFGVATFISVFMSMAGEGGSLGCIEDAFK